MKNNFHQELLRTIQSLIKINYSYFLAFMIMVIISISVSCYKSVLFDKLQETELKIAPFNSISKKQEAFILKHAFSKDGINFKRFITELGGKNFATVTNISKLDTINLHKLKKTKYSIVLFFWHDKFIFQFLEGLQDLRPGFLKLLNIKISKVSKVNEFKPFLKLEVLCEIFQKR